MFEFKLPDIGEGVAEGEVVKWLVKEGDSVKEDQPIVEIMTDKATVEIASPKDGTIEKRMAGEGQVVKVGKVLVTINESGNGKSAATTAGKPEALFTASTSPPRSSTKMAPAMPTVPTPTASTPGTGRVLASPATRKMAREKGIDLSTFQGSGPAGRVTREDLDRALNNEPLAARLTTALSYVPKKTLPTGGEERTPLRGIRKKIAEHMVKSRQTAMHFTQVDEVDMTDLVEFREQTKEMAAAQGIKLTYLSFIVQAVCAALKKFPSLNGSLDDAKQEIVTKYYYNIGLALQTDAGLIVPVIKNADQKSVMELAAEIQMLADKGREGKLTVEELSGGTFTVTSTGSSGGLMATPIINHPELGILGVHRIKDAPVVKNGQIVIRKMGHFSLSLDHRVIDGAVGAAFLKTLIQYVEYPHYLLLDA